MKHQLKVFRTKVSLSNNFKPRLLPTTMSMCDKDKENRSGLCKGYEFTPDSVEGDPSLRGGGSRLVSIQQSCDLIKGYTCVLHI